MFVFCFQAEDGIRILVRFFFQAEDDMRNLVRSRGIGEVYKRQLPGLPKGAENLKNSLKNRLANFRHGPRPCPLYTSDAADEEDRFDFCRSPAAEEKNNLHLDDSRITTQQQTQ